MGYARVWDRPVVVLCAGLRAHIGHREKKKIIAWFPAISITHDEKGGLHASRR